MQYEKQQFRSGDTLYASQLNAMEDGICASGAELDELKTALQFTGPSEHYVLRTLRPETSVTKSIVIITGPSSYRTLKNLNLYNTGDVKTGYAIYAVEPGSTYYVTGSTGTNQAEYPLCGFYDESGNCLGPYTPEAGTIYYSDVPVTIPQDACYLLVEKVKHDPKQIAVKSRIDSTGVPVIDTFTTSLLDIEQDVQVLQEQMAIQTEVTAGAAISPTSTAAGIWDIQQNAPHFDAAGVNDSYLHAWYDVEENTKYFVSCVCSGNPQAWPGCAFYDANGMWLESACEEQRERYVDYLVTTPPGAAKMVLSRAYYSLQLSAKTAVLPMGVSGAAGAGGYNLNMASKLVELEQRNPFRMLELDKGYVSFVFDDLWTDLDLVAAIFEEYGYPLGVAAIPENLGRTANGLSQSRGSFTPGMGMPQVVNQILANGGEVFAHNDPWVTETNQWDYAFMYDYFVSCKQKLEAAGFHPRGILRAGGTGRLHDSDEIQRWLVGNYEYSDMGSSLPQYMFDRIATVNAPFSTIQSQIRAAKANKQWLRFGGHSFQYQSDSFTREEDLAAILQCCQDEGVEVVTFGYMVDHFGSNALSLSGGSGAGTPSSTLVIQYADGTSESRGVL
ncbi:MAG: hypothetical protein IKS29_00810 [Oscillospiraceae bacterium]|nr:hypothetical protein [Oscillospiraceae bacterium]